MSKTFIKLPGGRLKRNGNRFGGNDAEHECFSFCERRRQLMRVLDAEFVKTVTELDRSDETTLSDSPSCWTLLRPMSGKYQKTTYVIEGDFDTAVRVYAARNGNRHPQKTSCDCGCGADYFVDEMFGTLATVTAPSRNCKVVWRQGVEVFVEGKARSNASDWDYQTIEQFIARPDVIVIAKSEISDAERQHPVPPVTYPSMYSQDEQTLAWLLDAEI